jgi:hypothetical protein
MPDITFRTVFDSVWSTRPLRRAFTPRSSRNDEYEPTLFTIGHFQTEPQIPRLVLGLVSEDLLRWDTVVPRIARVPVVPSVTSACLAYPKSYRIIPRPLRRKLIPEDSFYGGTLLLL